MMSRQLSKQNTQSMFDLIVNRQVSFFSLTPIYDPALDNFDKRFAIAKDI